MRCQIQISEVLASGGEMFCADEFCRNSTAASSRCQYFKLADEARCNWGTLAMRGFGFVAVDICR